MAHPRRLSALCPAFLTAQSMHQLTAQSTHQLTAQSTHHNPLERNQWRRHRFAMSLCEDKERARHCAIVAISKVGRRERGYGETWIADQVERFRDHHLSKGTALRDIDAAWRNWQRIAFDRDEEPPDPPSSASASTTHAVVREHLGEAGLMLLSSIGETAFCHWFG